VARQRIMTVQEAKQERKENASRSGSVLADKSTKGGAHNGHCTTLPSFCQALR
jgi:hypothetical protein